jgi:hypothetical protein
MTSPDPKTTQNAAGEGGGMLPALLAGAGILAVAALFIFGGDDEAKTEASAKGKDAQAQAANAQAVNNPKGGVAARQADDATKSSRPTPRLNPRIANAIVTEGMAPVPHKKPEPTSWDSVEEEIAYWEQELRDANAELEMRQRAQERVPGEEQRIAENGTPEDLAQFQRRKQVVADNLERAQARVEEVELKLQGLHGG